MSVNHSLGVLFMTLHDVILTKLNNSKINQKQFVFIRREWEQLQQTSAELKVFSENIFCCKTYGLKQRALNTITA